MNGSDKGVWRTFVKKSLQPAANASCRSLCNELAVKATMMTGLLKSAVFIRLSSSSGTWSISSPFANVGVVEALFEKTPMLLTRSNRLISLVASRPFITGNWISMRTKWKPPSRHLVTASFPFMAVLQRTFKRFMKASSRRRLMILSSTMRTLIGGTAPSRTEAASVDVCTTCFLERLVLGALGRGPGEETRGIGGVAALDGDSSGIGGVGIGAGFEYLRFSIRRSVLLVEELRGGNANHDFEHWQLLVRLWVMKYAVDRTWAYVVSSLPRGRLVMGGWGAVQWLQQPLREQDDVRFLVHSRRRDWMGDEVNEFLGLAWVESSPCRFHEAADRHVGNMAMADVESVSVFVFVAHR